MNVFATLLGALVGIGALALGLWALADVLRTRGERDELRHDPEPVFVGGLRLASGLKLSRPLARLELRHDEAVLSVAAGFGRLAARVAGLPLETELPFRELAGIERGPFDGVRFRTADPDDARDGIVFWPYRDDRDAIVGQLERTVRTPRMPPTAPGSESPTRPSDPRASSCRRADGSPRRRGAGGA